MSLLTRILVRAGVASTRSDNTPSGEPSGSMRSLFLEPRANGDEPFIGAAPLQYEGARTSETRYAPIRKAVEERLIAFLRRDVVSHLEIGHDDEFILHFVEIRPEVDADPSLERFLQEFTKAARIDWVKKFVRSAAEEHVRMDQFLGVDRTCPRESLGPADLYDEELNRTSALPAYRVTLYGRWEKRIPAPVSSGSRRRGPSLRLIVHDGNVSSREGADAREVTLDSFPAVLGTSSETDVVVAGHYVSARQCTVGWDGERIWLEDHSTNGTWANGRQVERGSRIGVNDGMLISFGREAGDTDYARFPLVQARLDAPTRERRVTPVVGSASTPIVRKETPLLLEKTPLAFIQVRNSPSRIRILEMPFTIGRASDQDYIVPEVNEGVSREHLVIREMTEAGALTVNKAVAKNGTYAHDLVLPDEFEWRFDQEIVLARNSKTAPPVHLVLKRPA
jgi:pSer/pThr/pTyr-binding forkhead associated (FHA) protein